MSEYEEATAHKIMRGKSKPAKSALTKQAFEAQINAEANPCCVKGGYVMPSTIGMRVLGGLAIGADHNRLIKNGAKKRGSGY